MYLKLHHGHYQQNRCSMGIHLSRQMTKQTKWLCVQRRLRSAWASAQSDQSLRCPRVETFRSQLPTGRTAKTLIRLGGCRDWTESSLGAHSFCWFCHVVAHFLNACHPFRLSECMNAFCFWNKLERIWHERKHDLEFFRNVIISCLVCILFVYF